MALDPSCTGALSPDQRKQWRRKADRLALQRDRELEAARRISETLFHHTEVDELVEMMRRPHRLRILAKPIRSRKDSSGADKWK